MQGEGTKQDGKHQGVGIRRGGKSTCPRGTELVNRMVREYIIVGVTSDQILKGKGRQQGGSLRGQPPR